MRADLSSNCSDGSSWKVEICLVITQLTDRISGGRSNVLLLAVPAIASSAAREDSCFKRICEATQSSGQIWVCRANRSAACFEGPISCSYSEDADVRSREPRRTKHFPYACGHYCYLVCDQGLGLVRESDTTLYAADQTH